MLFRFSAEQEELRRSARRFLAENSRPRAGGTDAALWRRLGGELGWTGLAIAEADGGAGLTWVELVAVLEEMGRALPCVPFLAGVLAASALETAGDAAQRARWLPGIAAGDTVATLAFTGPVEPAGVTATAVRDGGDYLISGPPALVLDGDHADLLIVPARAGEAGVSLFAVPGGAPGLGRRPLPTLDQTRRLGEVALAEVRVPAEARLGAEGAAWPALARVLDLGCIALAAEQVGGAERCLDMAVDYARTRMQFGRPIGAFQAIKHRLADLLLLVESARSAAYWAGWCVAAGNPEVELAAPAAAAYCGEAFFTCAAENIQVHGGIGFTWEHDAHLYFKRASSAAVLLGGAAHHRERLARRVGI